LNNDQQNTTLKIKENRQERRSLEKELNAKLAKRDSMNVEDTNLNDHINLLEIKLEKIYQEKAKGAQVRARFACFALSFFSKDLRSCLFSLIFSVVFC
jgi:chromosome segregation ATPase